jgi:phenylacetate-CoA ligase
LGLLSRGLRLAMIKFRIADFFSPWRIFHWRRLLWRSQYYSDDEMRALQWELLSRLLKHCFENVAYYRKGFAELGLHPSDFRSVDDLSLVPVINKRVVLGQHEEFKADNFERFRPREVHTSGTTGTPLSLYWDADSNVLELVCQWRHFSWSGYRLGEPFLDIRSRVLDATKGYLWNPACRGLEASCDNIDAGNVGRYAELLRRYRIKLWRGHPGAISCLCRCLSDAGISDVRPKYVVTSAEPLLGYQREFIQSWAGVRVCDNYGLVEHNALICQCPGGGHHVACEYGIIEILKDDGTPAQAGEEGRIVATGLHNKAFPLLRYDTGDYAVQSDRRCSCGRTLRLVEAITGRIDDRVLRADGRWISGLQREFYFAEGIIEAQLVQEQVGRLDVYLVPAEGYGEEVENHLCKEFKRRLGESMEIRIHRVKEIPFRSPGKSKLVVNKLGFDDSAVKASANERTGI